MLIYIKVILIILTFLWILLRPFFLRNKVKKNQSLQMPDIPQLICFPCFFLILVLIKASIFHLLWLFPFSFLAGLLLLKTNLGLKMSIYILAFLGS